MKILLIAWFVWAGVVLIWCSLARQGSEYPRTRIPKTAPKALSYIKISLALLNDWEMHHSNLLLIDLGSDKGTDTIGSGIPSSIRVPAAKLAQMLRWVPPGSRVVFYNEVEGNRFSAAVERALLNAGIDGVFILEGVVGSSAHKFHRGRPLHDESSIVRF